MLSRQSLFAGRIVHTIAATAAWFITLGRALVAVQVGRVVGTQWRRLDAWLDHDDDAEGCLHIDALGWHAEVFYMKPNAGPVATS